MRKIHLLLVALCLFQFTNAQIINFPDDNFKTKLLAATASNGMAENLAGFSIKIDANNDGQIQVNEAIQVKKLGLSIGPLTISNMAGIEYFTNLVTLRCDGHPLTNLVVTALPQLKELICNNTNLTTLNLSNQNNLEILDYSNNPQLTNLTVSNSNIIKNLYCRNNQLTSLNLSLYPQLKVLIFNGNSQLPMINFSLFPNLEAINCSGNILQTNVNVTGLTNLQTLFCDDLGLTNLDLSTNLQLVALSCSGNQLTTLNLNHLNLVALYCNDNQLQTIFAKGLHTTFGIDSLFFYGNPNLQYICCNEATLNEFQTKVNQYNYSNCVVNTYCTFTPGGISYTIQGNNKFDDNNDGCSISDSNFPNIKFEISDGFVSGHIITGSMGSFTIPVEGGTHTLTPILESPLYFTVSPPNVTVTFPGAMSPSLQDFCITPNGVHNDLEVTLLPMTIARPGFDVAYKIICKNKGNHIQSAVLNFGYNDFVLDFVSATPTFSSQSANLLTWNLSNLSPFEERILLVTLNLNSPIETPAVNAGDILNYTAVISGQTDDTPVDNTIVLNQPVTNSLDPNDKKCMEGATMPPAMIGEYVHYMIRFENSGTANAQNIVVMDRIDMAKFDIGTILPTSGSHSFITRITDSNKVEFIFENINLPFDNANNDGYVAFKIKTKPTLVVGDTFSNNANIYFDYNFPIITNTATTTIQALGNPDFEFENYFALAPNPASEFLNIQVKNDIEISSISIYNTLGQLILVVTEPTNSIDISSLKTGNYFIKVVTSKGVSSSKFIKE